MAQFKLYFGNSSAAVGPTLITVRPSADITTGAWTSAPSGDLYSVIDEVTYDDVDYISTITPSTAEVRLAPASDPASSSNHTITFRAKSIGGLSLQVKLYQNTTLIATTTPTLNSIFQDFIWVLSGAEADAITNYSDLRVRFVAV